MKKILLDIPHQYKPLFEPYRFKIMYGGRYGAKDWSTVQVLVFLAMLHDPTGAVDALAVASRVAEKYGINPELIYRSIKFPHRIICLREMKVAIKKSIHQLIKDTIVRMGAGDFFDITDTEIRCYNGSKFCFDSLWKNVANIKSLEGATIAVYHEAEAVSEESWSLVLPTMVRVEGVENWVIFNTRYIDDPTYDRFVLHTPSDAWRIFINSFDVEQYLTDEARQQRADDELRDPVSYRNIWKGEPLGTGRRVFPEFSEGMHVRHYEISELKKFNANFIMAMDPAQNYYPAVGMCAIWPDRLEPTRFHKHFYAEYPAYDKFKDYFANIRYKVPFSGTVEQLAREMAAAACEDGFGDGYVKISNRYIDTRFAKGVGGDNYINDTLGINRRFEEAKMPFTMPSERNIDTALDRIKADLRTRNPILKFDAGRNDVFLTFDPSCRNLIMACKSARLKDSSETIEPKYKDFVDMLKIMYAGILCFDYNQPENDEEQKDQPGLVWQSEGSSALDTVTAWRG